MNFQIALEFHKNIFPKATVISQLLHLNEEIEEMETASSLEKALDELGDILFVAISLLRFEETKIIAELVLDKYYFSYPVEEQKEFMKRLDKAVKKVESRKATYIFDGKRYTRNKNIYK